MNLPTPHEPEPQRSQFELDLSPMDTIIALVFTHKMQRLLDEHYTNYKETSLSNTSAKKDILDIVKTYVKECLSQVSRRYRRKILREYFSNEGLVLYISGQIYDLVHADLSNRLNNAASG